MTAATGVTGGWKKLNILGRMRRAMTSTPCNTGTQIRPLSSRHPVQMEKSDGSGATGSVRTLSRLLPWLAFRRKLIRYLSMYGPKTHPPLDAVYSWGMRVPHLPKSIETIASHHRSNCTSAECPLLAQSGPWAGGGERPLFDPKRTFVASIMRFGLPAQHSLVWQRFQHLRSVRRSEDHRNEIV